MLYSHAASTAAMVDVLVYTNGDRVHGHFISRENNQIVFESLHFGKITVSAADARVLTAVRPAEIQATTTVTVTATPPDLSAEPAEAAPKIAHGVIYNTTNQAMERLAKHLSNIFGPWHGRVSFSSEVRLDDDEKSQLVLEGRMQREWAQDNVRFGARYEFGRNNGATKTDEIKAEGYWRHDFSNHLLSLYSPTLEWNRSNFTEDDVPDDYVFLQQQVGIGYNLLARDDQKLRIGVAENLFNIWRLEPKIRQYFAHTEALFFEAELTLPYHIAITDRGSWYYAFSDGATGWENQFEVAKKLSETLSLAVRQEVRHNTPGLEVKNYTLWRFLLGLDF